MEDKEKLVYYITKCKNHLYAKELHTSLAIKELRRTIQVNEPSLLSFHDSEFKRLRRDDFIKLYFVKKAGARLTGCPCDGGKLLWR